MSTELPQKVHSHVLSGRITVVAARYNEKYTDALLQNCLDELAEAAPGVEVEVVRVPGAFEVPMMVKRAIVQPVSGETPSAVIAFGVILRGSTAHADLINQATAKAFTEISVSSGVPVIDGVVSAESLEQAVERCGTKQGNKGFSAMQAAIETANVAKKL